MTLTTVNAGMLDTQAQYNGFKNRIINGAMVISQRNTTTATSQVHAAYNLDRFWGYSYNSGNQTGKYTVAQSSTAPAGFTNSLLVTSSAATSISANDLYSIGQHIEGFNTADLAWGTANASTVTLSFWVRCSLTGTFGGIIKNQNNNYNYPFQFTISSANTFEYKTITISGPTSGTWQTDNSTGLTVSFNLQVGTSITLTANGTWQASSGYGATGCVNILNTNGATFYITGVQLEKGSTATSFDYRPYGTEFILCQRYYETSYPVGYAAGYNFGGGYPFSTSKPLAVNLIASDDTTTTQSVRFVVVKRTSPTVVIYSASDGASGFTFTYKATGGNALNVSAGATYTSENLWNINQALSVTGQANESYFHFTASAEL